MTYKIWDRKGRYFGWTNDDVIAFMMQTNGYVVIDISERRHFEFISRKSFANLPQWKINAFRKTMNFGFFVLVIYGTD